jgi:ubiquinone biosynthesis protein
VALRPDIFSKTRNATFEGASRKLDPQLNMWSTAEPVVAWIADNLGPVGRLDDLNRGLSFLAAFLADAAPRRARRAPLQPPVVTHRQHHNYGN